MRAKEILGLIAIMVIALIVISFIREKKRNERMSRVENILGNLLVEQVYSSEFFASNSERGLCKGG